MFALSHAIEELGDQFAFQRYLLLRFLGLPQAELEAEEVLLAQQIREELQSVCVMDGLPQFLRLDWGACCRLHL